MRPILLVGAGEAGAMTLREIRRHPASGMEVVGFIDDDPKKHGQSIDGLRVLGGREAIPSAVAELGVVEILIAIPSATGEQIRTLVAACREVKTRFRIVPGLISIIRGDVDYDRIRAIRPEDLLGREMTELDPSALVSFARDKKILVTGAGGSIGSELVRQLARAGARLVLLDHSESGLYEIMQELNGYYGAYESDRARKATRYFEAHIADIRNAARVKAIVSSAAPEVVFHAAAYKHVPLMEENVSEAAGTNVLGTRILADACEAAGARQFVFISTDKAVEPTSVMGATKRAAELLLLSTRRKMAISAVRFGNVFGSSGSASLLFMKQIQAGGPVTVTDPEVVRYFMSIAEAVTLVIQSAILGGDNELYVLEMGQPIRILDLARSMITLAGLRPEKDIAISFTGLRPGEKLIEEVLTASQHARATIVPKVFRIDGDKVAVSGFEDLVRGMERASLTNDEAGLLELLRKMVPEYR